MERFSAATFQHIASGLTLIIGPLEQLPQGTDASDLAIKYIPIVEWVKKDCEKIGLKTSVFCANDFISLADGMTIQQLTGALRELDNTIRREMQGILFFHMPSDRGAFYSQPELFGQTVAAAFPNAQYDIAEAGNCYAMGRSTACVFHLMRVMEMAVQCFGAKLGVTFADTKDWHSIMEQTDKAIRGLNNPKSPDTVAMNQASAYLYNVKVAWRNRVMHPHDKYTLEEAKDILLAVKSFMVQLSDII